MISELKQIEIEKIKDLPNDDRELKIKRINDCKSIIELGYSVESAIKTIETYGIPVVLREDDKVIIPHEDVEFDSMDDFIAVHKDEFLPVDSMIQTPTEAKAKLKTNYFFGGRWFQIESIYFRDTVHLSLNGEVEEIGPTGSNWDEFPIAFLIKLKKVPIGKKGSYSLGDTYSDGHIDLDEDTWILCPQGFKEKILKNNPRIKV